VEVPLLFDVLRTALLTDHAEDLDDGNQLALRVVDATRAAFGGTVSFKILVVLHLNNRTVDFSGTADAALAHVAAMAGGKAFRVTANWLVIGQGAGIYLFEELDRKDNNAYRGMRNTLCTMDTDNGKTFFELGTPANDRISWLFEDLFAQAGNMGREAFIKGFREAFDKLSALMDRKRPRTGLRRIRP
jgi:hypothetical protein